MESLHIPLRRYASSVDGTVSIDLDRLENTATSPRKSMRRDSSDAHTFSCTAWLISTISNTLKSLIPRRLDEPTGPFELVILFCIFPALHSLHGFNMPLTNIQLHMY